MNRALQTIDFEGLDGNSYRVSRYENGWTIDEWEEEWDTGYRSGGGFWTEYSFIPAFPFSKEIR